MNISKRKLNVLTNSEEVFRSRSEILGKLFDVEVYLTADGDLNLAIDGNETVEEAAELISNKCQVPTEAVLPLLVVNLAVLYQNAAKKQEIVENLLDLKDKPTANPLETKVTIH